MSLETNKSLGGVGALLMFIGIIPYINFFGVIEIVGVILVMVALYNLGSYYREGGIFNNALYGFIIGIVGVVISIAVVIIMILTRLTSFLHTLYPGWNGDWTKLPSLTPNPSNFSLSNLMPFLAGIFVALIIFWVVAIISAFFIRRSLGMLSAKSGVGLFSTAGLLLLIGAALIVALGIGLILIWISALLLTIAFFEIKPQQAQPTAPTAALT